MQFSVITCTYNSAQYLIKNINSVKEQDFNDFEHIFIDGYSTDDTLKIINDYISKYPNRTIKLYQSKALGISHAMNQGIKYSNGKFLIHLHSDDSFYKNNVLSDINGVLEENANLDWVYGKANVIDENGVSVGVFPNRKILHFNSKNIVGKYLLKFFNFIPHQAVFIKKEVFTQFGDFDESVKSGMDPDLWMRIRNKTKWSFVDVIVCNFMIRATAQSSSKNNDIENKNAFKYIQSKHMNRLELFLASILNKLIDLYNNTKR